MWYILLILLILLLYITSAHIYTDKKQYHYKKKKSIMTSAEIDCYQKLCELYSKNYLIFSQVRLSSILDEHIKGQNWRSALAHINQKSVDFVILDKKSFNILAVIECDDVTHNKKERIDRDQEINRILLEAGVPIYRLKNTLNKTPLEIKEDINKQKSSH